MRKILAAGNWKMNNTPSQAEAMINELKGKVAGCKNDVLICPTYVCLPAAVKAAEGSNIKIGAQNLHFEDKGAFTGEISAEMLKEIGVPLVWVKAKDLQHQMILEKVGADRVIQPENEMGIRIAHHMDSEKVVDYIDLSEDYSIVELVASEKLMDQSLLELDIRAKYHCTILAIKRGDEVNVAPMSDDQVKLDDVLVAMGHRDDLKRFEAKGI